MQLNFGIASTHKSWRRSLQSLLDSVQILGKRGCFAHIAKVAACLKDIEEDLSWGAKPGVFVNLLKGTLENVNSIVVCTRPCAHCQVSRANLILHQTPVFHARNHGTHRVSCSRPACSGPQPEGFCFCCGQVWSQGYRFRFV